jgi:hypothetical protein
MAKRKTGKPLKLATPRTRVVAKIIAPRPVTEIVTERTYTTTEPEVEIRKPATLSQALTERAEVVVKPKTKVEKVVRRSRRRAA